MLKVGWASSLPRRKAASSQRQKMTTDGDPQHEATDRDGADDPVGWTGARTGR
jgi:hypothetical protein